MPATAIDTKLKTTHHNESAPEPFRQPALTKVIATLGPATSDPAVVRRLIEAGVSIFRLNFSHGEPADHLERLTTVRKIAQTLGRPTAIMGDLPGPKIRINKSAGQGCDVPAGAMVVLERGEPNVAVDKQHDIYRFATTYAQLVDDVEPGQRVLIADGSVRMLCTEKTGDSISCVVKQGGLIAAGKGINLPDTNLTLPVLTERDRTFVRWAVDHEIDFLALSFVRHAADIEALRKLVKDCGGIKQSKSRENEGDGAFVLRIPLIAKIELPAALKQIDAILDAADGIMVARGDLGVEMDLAEVPVIQKKLIAAARTAAKPCIVATQMLESMISSLTPTRAEASDVAGAIFDGADAVMLSGETAVGKYPLLAVEHMHRIAMQTEKYIAESARTGSINPVAQSKPIETRYRTAVLAHGAWTIVQDMDAKFVVVWSQHGGGARYLSQLDFCVPIVAVSSDDRALRQMQLLRGVTPVRMNEPEDLAHFTRMVDAYLLETSWANEGDSCVLVAGEPLGRAGVTNRLAIHKIGDPRDGFQPG